MKKVTIFLILLVLIIVLASCFTRINTPDELAEFYDNTRTNKYWGISTNKDSVYLYIKQNNYYKWYSIGLIKNELLSFPKFKNNLYDITVKDSRNTESVISWMKKRDGPLYGPDRYDVTSYTAYNQDKYFDQTSNELSVKSKVFNFKKLDNDIIEDWYSYQAEYSLKGAKGGLPIPIEAYQGEVRLVVNDKQTKIKEAYLHDSNWILIRHLEKGEFPKEIDDKDLDSILESVWWAWEKKLHPFSKKLNKMK